MFSPDADEALLTISRWQREAMVNRALAAWWQGKDDGLPPAERLNDNQDQYGATLNAVRREMAYDHH